MSDSTTTETALTLDLTGVQDESRPVDGDAFLAFLPDWAQATSRAVTEHVRATGAAKKLAAARVAARAMIIRANGFPDWQADSDVYSLAVQAVESPIVAAKLSADAKRRFDAAVRQHVKRNFLLPGMVGHIGTTEPNFGDEFAAFLAAETEDAREEAMQAILANPSDKLKRRVREHYAAAGLNVPEGVFAEVVTNASPGPVAGDPASAFKTLDTALGGLSQIVPTFAVGAILKSVSAVSAKMLDGKLSEVKERPKVVATLHRISTVCTLTAKALEGKAEEQDEKLLQDAYWSKEQDEQ